MSDFNYDDELPDGIFYEGDADDSDVDFDFEDYGSNDDDSDVNPEGFDSNDDDTSSDSSKEEKESSKKDDDSNNESVTEDHRDTELHSAGEKQGPKTPQEKFEESFLSTKLTKCEAKMKVLEKQLQTMTAATTPQVLTPSQSSTLKEAESLIKDNRCKILNPIKTRNISNLAKKINIKVLSLKASYWMQKLGPILPYIGIGLLVIILLIVVIAAIGSAVAFFQSKTDPANMSANSCITTEFFYGTRSVFVDEESLINSLQLSYKQYVVDVIENIDENNSITINISLPEEFDNSTEIDTHITNMSLGIANIVATNSSDYINVDINTLYPEIEYFGLTTEQGNLTNDFITKYFKDNNIITPESGDMSEIDALIDTSMQHENLQYVYNLCEKFMIKDEIASEKGLENIQNRLYVASIYMPNKDILIESAYYTISSVDEVFNAKSQLIHEENGNQNILREKETTDNRDIITGFTAGQVKVKQFTSIDSENPNAFNSEISIFQAIRLAPQYKDYFTLNSETGAYTWKPTCESLYYLSFEAETKFIFTDYDLNVKLP